jgi:hypothetical protein
VNIERAIDDQELIYHGIKPVIVNDIIHMTVGVVITPTRGDRMKMTEVSSVFRDSFSKFELFSS